MTPGKSFNLSEFTFFFRWVKILTVPVSRMIVRIIPAKFLTQTLTNIGISLPSPPTQTGSQKFWVSLHLWDLLLLQASFWELVWSSLHRWTGCLYVPLTTQNLAWVSSIWHQKVLISLSYFHGTTPSRTTYYISSHPWPSNLLLIATIPRATGSWAAEA